jgi:hypothetical protein
LNPCDIFVGKAEEIVYEQSTLLEELQANIGHKIVAIPIQQLPRVSRNVFSLCENMVPEAECRRSKILL